MASDPKALAERLTKLTHIYVNDLPDEVSAEMLAAAARLREPHEYVGGNCRVCGKHDGQHAPAPADEEVARHLETRFCNEFGIEDVATRIHVVRSVRGATVRAVRERARGATT